MKDFISYLYKVSSVAFCYGAGQMTERTKDFRIAEATITSKATSSSDAAKAVKRFLGKYDKGGLSSDAKTLVDLFIESRPEAVDMLNRHTT